MLNIPIKEMIAAAARVHPNEACGLVIKCGAGYRFVECENTAVDKAESFLIDPVVFLRHAHEVVAVFHSHPNRSAEPSQTDKLCSFRLQIPYFIVSYPSEEIFYYTPGTASDADLLGRDFFYGISDCLTLVADYYWQELRIKIVHDKRKEWEWWLKPENYHEFINGFIAQGFKRVESLQKHDVIIMINGSYCPNHAAVYVGDGLILHHPSAGTKSRIEQYGQHWRQATCAILRFGNEEN